MTVATGMLVLDDVLGGGVEKNSKIEGNIHGEKINLSKDATVKGKVFAKKGISFIEPSASESEKKVERFKTDTDIVDEVENMLE